MFFSSFYTPHPALHPFVRHLRIIHVQFDPAANGNKLPVKPYPPSTEQCLYFYPYDRPQSTKAGSDTAERTAMGNVMGQPLTRMNIMIQPNYLMLKVSFQPGGIFRLLGLPMDKIADGHADLRSVAGRAIDDVNEQLLNTAEYDTMIQIVEQFLLRKAARCRQSQLPIDRVAQQMLDPAGYHQLDRLAADACLSTRQFERKFRERVGVSLKLFTRISRFRQAYQLRETDPDRSWLDIAYACSYYDPNHLIKDFQQFAGTSPGQLFAEDQVCQDLFRQYRGR